MNKLARDEKGYALILVLILLLLGSLLILPLLGYMTTGLKTGLVYEKKTNELYTADAGIQEGIWRIKYNYWGGELHSRDYDKYDFSTNWSYQTEPVNGITANIAIENVWIPTTRTPSDYGYSTTQVKNIIESTHATYPKLMISGTANVTSGAQYNIKIYYSPGTGEENALRITSVGVWLPLGFSYAGNCNMEADTLLDLYYSDPTVSPHCGGEAVVWEFSSANFTFFPNFVSSGGLQSCEITFDYTANETGAKPTAISWITTDSGVSDILPVTWDIDTMIYQIKSVARDTTIEAYSSKCELRTMTKAMAGDYKAIGNTLIKDSGSDGIRDAWLNPVTKESTAQVSDIPHSANVGYADVVAAYLYWSAWLNQEFAHPIWEPDSCDNFNNWNGPNKWWDIDTSGGNKKFCGKWRSSGTDNRYLEMKRPINLLGYTPGSVVVEWHQWEENGENLEQDDALKFQFSSNNGSSWSTPMTTAFKDDINKSSSSQRYFYYTVPTQYLTSTFKMRFYLDGFNESGENCYVDDIGIARIVGTADTTATFKIDNPLAPDYSGVVTASKSSVIGNTGPSNYSYACKADVTGLVRQYAEMVKDAYQIEHHTGNGKYTVGGVDAALNNAWAYAGWSLIIVYACPQTAGRQLYLYDDFIYADEETDVDFDKDGSSGGDITGFVIPQPIQGDVEAAKLTCFVGEGDVGYNGDFLAFNAPDTYRSNPWTIPNPPAPYKLWDGITLPTNEHNSSTDPNNVWNSRSVGLTADGIDIDTFSIPWTSDLLSPGDITAHIDLPTGTDSWNLIYIILSVRSLTVTGGTTFYLIR